MAIEEAPGNSGGVQSEEQHRRTLDVNEDLQNIRLVIHIDDDRTFEIPLKGKLILQEEEEDKEFLMHMRGWLMTVGTLFVTMAFQAALQPPAWLRTTDFLRLSQSELDHWNHRFHGASHAAAAAAAPARFGPSPSPSRQAAESATAGLSRRARLYMYFNYVTFGSSLTLVLMLLLNKPPRQAKFIMRAATFLLVEISFVVVVVVTVVLGTAEDWYYTLLAFGVIGIFGSLMLFPQILLTVHGKLSRLSGWAGGPSPRP